MFQSIFGLPAEKLGKYLEDYLARAEDGFAEESFLMPAPVFKSLCKAARKALLEEPVLLRLHGPLVVVGDVHGQFQSVLSLFNQFGHPPVARYLFLGDFVDRGPDGLEIMSLLMAYKLQFPDHLHMIRGNHECRPISSQYGFRDECSGKVGEWAWKAVNSVFDCLPLAAVIGGKMLCLHGGISSRLRSLTQLDRIPRPLKLDQHKPGLLTDILWSDPFDGINGFAPNSRGMGEFFGMDVLTRFLEQNQLTHLVRAHETQAEGYRTIGPDSACISIFSAPSYMGCRNQGAVMLVRKDMQYSFSRMQEGRKHVSGSSPCSVLSALPGPYSLSPHSPSMDSTCKPPLLTPARPMTQLGAA